MFVQSGGSVPNIWLPTIFQNSVNKKDIHLDLLRKLESNPKYTQRELSQEMGVSLGKINYCIKKLIKKGWLKAKNFQQSKNKKAYAYFLTPKGMEKKSKLTIIFLKRKMDEYELLKTEIEELQEEGKLWLTGKGMAAYQWANHSDWWKIG